MTTTTVHGVTVKCISSLEIGEVIDQLQDAIGPRWPDDPDWRKAIGALYEAQLHIEAVENAALLAGREAVRSGIGGLLRDMHPADLDANIAAARGIPARVKS